ncbi:Uncharacterised protein [Serratia fonticola]|uniref:Uncharacterized protein n=1 Tax=Serratia fonticola TaxID=47917 RepID=A0A4U9UTV0_SERFO|nr:Uncharacterised protein [Serratia fonticola]
METGSSYQVNLTPVRSPGKSPPDRKPDSGLWLLLFCSCCTLAKTFTDGFADGFQRRFSIVTTGGKAQVMTFFHSQCHNLHQAAAVSRFTAAVEIGDGNFTRELFDYVD